MKLRKLGSFILSAVLVMGLGAPEFAYAAPIEMDTFYEEAQAITLAASKSVTCKTQSALEKALAKASTEESSPTVITISKDIDIDGQIVVEAGTFVTLQSASSSSIKSLTAQEAYPNKDDGGMVYVKGNLTVKNLTLDGDYNGRVVLVDPGASLTLGSKATVKRGQEMGPQAEKGLGIYVRDGSKTKYATIKMKKGAKITGCRSKGKGNRFETSGIGLYVGKYAQFTMSGGEISKNVDKGNGEYNSPTAAGGGVYVQNYATMTMTGGKIIKNSARYGGGGIYVNGMYKSSEVILKGNALIAENEAAPAKQASEYGILSGGGICVAEGVVRMSGNAVIRDNLAKSNFPEPYSGCGGGVYIINGDFYMSGGTISGNKAQMDYQGVAFEADDKIQQGNGGGIFVRSGGCYISGGNIQENQAKTNFKKNKFSGYGGGICVGFEHDIRYASNSALYLSGGEIKGNSVTKKGKDLYLFNHVAHVAKDTAYCPVRGVTTVGRTSKIYVSGSPVVGDAYLPADYKEAKKVVSVSRFTLQGNLEKDASIGVRFASAKKGVVFGDSTDSYTIRSNDVKRFKLLNTKDEKLVAEINDDGNLELVPETAGTKKKLTNAKITVSSVTFDRTAQKPEPQVVLEDRTLTKGTDYSVSYENNVNAGTATVIINGRGKYTGTKQKTFKINPLSLNSTDIKVEAIGDKYATGEAIHPIPVITHGEYELNSDGASDFTCTYGENLEEGTGTVTVTGQGNYTGTLTLSFQIRSDVDYVIHSEDELLEALSQSGGSESNPVRIVLAKNLSFSQTFELASGLNAVLDGNGYTLTMGSKHAATTSNPHEAMFQVPLSATLALADIVLDANANARLVYVAGKLTVSSDSILRRGKASGDDNEKLGGQCIYNDGTVLFAGKLENSLNGYWGSVYNNGDFTLETSGVFNNLKTTSGGVVYNKGTFYMDGIISKPGGATNLGAAITNLGTVNMAEGVIQNGSSDTPAIYNRGTFNMSGGSIRNNENTQGSHVGVSGGTVYQQEGVFTMSGGSITGNTALEGGGVMLAGGTFHMNGVSASIDHNQALYVYKSTSWQIADYGNGGGVFLNAGEFIMDEGSITGNLADYVLERGTTDSFSGNGGAVLVNGGSLQLNGGTISGNKSHEKNMQGICFANQKVGSTAADTSAVGLSGSPVIADLIYMEKGQVLSILGRLGDISVTVKQEDLSHGTVLAKYADASYAQESDGGKFIAYKSSLGYEYDPTNAQIVVGKIKLSDCVVTLEQDSYSYTGRAIIPDVMVKDADGNEISSYELDVTNNVECGTATLVVSGDEFETTGEVTLTFDIVPRTLTDKNLKIVEPKQVYTGEALTPEVTVKVNNKELVPDQDYVISYKDNVNGHKGDGIATVEVQGIGNYTGKATAHFSIKQFARISVSASASVECGKTLQLKPKIVTGDKEHASYRYTVADKSIATVSAKGVVTAIKKGTTVVTVTLKESDGYFETSAEIEISTLQGTQSVTGVEETIVKVYTTKAWELGARSTGNGKLSYKSSDTSVAEISKDGKVTAMGYGKTTVTITAKETASYKKASAKITLYIKPKQMKIKALSNKKAGCIKVTWNVDPNAHGYQVQYSTSPDMKDPHIITINKKEATSYTIHELEAGKTYYVQLHVYKRLDNRHMIGEWSEVKSIKVSK